MPSKKFADGAEIFRHCRNIGKHFGLYDGALFSTQVRDLRWEDAAQRWQISTNRGDDIRARFVVMAQGSYNRPKLPGIPGIKDFAGHVFHSARWDYDYTGGDADGGLHKLADKRVAWSAPAPPASSWCRTSAATPRNSSSSSALRPRSTHVPIRPPTRTGRRRRSRGWQEERKRNFHNWSPFVGVVFGEPDLVCDFWTELGRNLTARIAEQR